jgi:catechol 2,3-dioxygenase-like lactoylglutathione lyase family enzyme
MSFRIGKNFHIIHMSDDLRALDAWYYDIFSVHRFMPDSYMPAEVRDASLVLIGDLCVETLAPAFRVEGWDTKPLGRFYRRHGKRFHSLAWYVDEGMDALYGHLRAAGVRCYTTGGVPVDSDEAPRALFTDPRDTGTQLEFVPVETRTLMRDPRFKPGWSPSWWADRHPLHVQKLSHVTVTTRDAAQAAQFYETVLHAPVVYRGDTPSNGCRHVFMLVGEDLMIELAEPLDESSPIARDMDRYHESIYSLTYKVRDLTGAEEYLARKGVGFSARDGTTLVTDPATSQGAVMGFTTWSIPGDPRLDWTEQP